MLASMTVLWDLCFEEDPLGALGRQLDAYRPDLIAIGLRNIQNMDYTGIDANMAFYREMMQVVRRHSDQPVLLGGGGFSVMPVEIMKDLLGFDCVSFTPGESEALAREQIDRFRALEGHYQGV